MSASSEFSDDVVVVEIGEEPRALSSAESISDQGGKVGCTPTLSHTTPQFLSFSLPQGIHCDMRSET